MNMRLQILHPSFCIAKSLHLIQVHGMISGFWLMLLGGKQIAFATIAHAAAPWNEKNNQ